MGRCHSAPLPPPPKKIQYTLINGQRVLLELFVDVIIIIIIIIIIIVVININIIRIIITPLREVFEAGRDSGKRAKMCVSPPPPPPP